MKAKIAFGFQQREEKTQPSSETGCDFWRDGLWKEWVQMGPKQEVSERFSSFLIKSHREAIDAGRICHPN